MTMPGGMLGGPAFFKGLLPLITVQWGATVSVAILVTNGRYEFANSILRFGLPGPLSVCCAGPKPVSS
jgi:hypothetical protein